MRFILRAITLILITFIIVFSFSTVMAQDEVESLKPYIASVQQSPQGMTLWQMIKAGGVIMVILFVISLFTVAIVIYNFMTVNERKLSPIQFVESIIEKLEKRDEDSVKEMCSKNENIFSRVVTAGLERKKHGKVFAKEAMENRARKEIAVLWQNISYLADIASVAPLIGLLGTVLGMIQAFNVIAFQTAVVKPILLAGGVSKAMVTTAGGLIVAIPTLLFYSFFRGKVQQISNIVENYNTDIIKLITES